MSRESDNIDDAARRALRHAPAVWTPQCPEPETLLDWIDRETAHPQAAALLDHVISCAYCRGEFAALCEIRGRTPVSAQIPRQAVRLRAWADELLTAGFTAPVAQARRTLETLGRLAAPAALALTRGASAPGGLRPQYTAVRTPRPVLRWSGGGPAQKYTLVVTRHTGKKTPHAVWQGSAGREHQMTVPEDAGLEPGGIYLWQVTAHMGGLEAVSAPAPFAVMAERTRRQLEALERHVDGATLDRIGLCEAYGLYDEALQQVEALSALRPDDALPAIRARLLEQMAG